MGPCKSKTQPGHSYVLTSLEQNYSLYLSQYVLKTE